MEPGRVACKLRRNTLQLLQANDLELCCKFKVQCEALPVILLISTHFPFLWHNVCLVEKN
jgi:hypothetical protein